MNKMNFLQRLLSKKVYEYDSGFNPKPIRVPEKKVIKPKAEMSQYESQRRALERNYNKGYYSNGIGVGP